MTDKDPIESIELTAREYFVSQADDLVEKAKDLQAELLKKGRYCSNEGFGVDVAGLGDLIAAGAEILNMNIEAPSGYIHHVRYEEYTFMAQTKLKVTPTIGEN